MRLEEVLQQMKPEDVDDVRYSLNQYTINKNRHTAHEMDKCIKHIKKSYPVEIYAPIIKIYSEIAGMK